MAAFSSLVMVLSSSLGAMDCRILVFRGRIMDTDGAVSVLNRVVTVFEGFENLEDLLCTFTSSSDKVRMSFIIFFRVLSVRAEYTVACCSRWRLNMS